MKQLRKLLAFAALVLALGSFNSAFAGPGKPEDTPGKPSDTPRGPGRGALEIPRLGVPPKVELPADLKALVDKYRSESEAFLAGQKDLLKQLKGATAEEKAKVKETLKANRDKFLEEHKELITEIRQQLAALKKDLKNHEKPIDAGGETGGGGRRRGGN